MDIPQLNYRHVVNGEKLVIAISQDYETGEVLMVAYMNRDAFEKTIETGKAHYWSTSRNQLWFKGESSGHVQRLVELRIDCDRDCLLALVEQEGPACHTNRRTCFYTAIRGGEEVELMKPMA